MSENQNQHLVGKEISPATVRVDKSRIRQFARAVGLDDAAYFDENEARKRGYPSLIAPPTLPIALGQDFEPGGGEMPRIKWNVATLLHEGTEIQYDRPIFAGDILTCKARAPSSARPPWRCPNRSAGRPSGAAHRHVSSAEVPEPQPSATSR
jgi:hypothetical protein